MRANAHETHDSIGEFVCRLPWSISSNFGKNSLLKCASQPKIAKKSLKTPIFGFKVDQGHRCLYLRKGRQQTLSYGKNPESHLGLNRYRIMTDGQTDGRTELRQPTCTKHYLLSCVKTLKQLSSKFMTVKTSESR